jgi:serine/threonine protein kinase
LTFEGVDTQGRAVAIKQLRFERLRDWKSLELFEREGRVLEQLSHPNIPAYIDFFAHDGQRPLSPLQVEAATGPVSWFLVQQFVRGAPLQRWVDERQPFEEERLVAILDSLLSTLDYLHKLHPPVIHRDIKPSNIVLSPDGQPFLVDFGAIQDHLRSESQMGSTLIGTQGYAPMEQFRGAARPSSDLYSLGMTILALASGRSPAKMPVDESTGKVDTKRVVPGLSPEFRALLDEMIEPLPGKRIVSAEAALRRVALLKTKSQATPPRRSLPSQPQQLSLPVRTLQPSLEIPPQPPSGGLQWWHVSMVLGCLVALGISFGSKKQRDLPTRSMSPPSLVTIALSSMDVSAAVPPRKPPPIPVASPSSSKSEIGSSASSGSSPPPAPVETACARWLREAARGRWSPEIEGELGLYGAFAGRIARRSLQSRDLNRSFHELPCQEHDARASRDLFVLAALQSAEAWAKVEEPSQELREAIRSSPDGLSVASQQALNRRIKTSVDPLLRQAKMPEDLAPAEALCSLEKDLGLAASEPCKRMMQLKTTLVEKKAKQQEFCRSIREEFMACSTGCFFQFDFFDPRGYACERSCMEKYNQPECPPLPPVGGR